MNEYLDLLDSTPTAPKPPASAPRNDYLALLDDDAEVQRRRLQGTLATSVSTNPDTYAANKQLAKYVGVPPIVAQTIPDEIKRRADVQRVQADIADSPVLARKFTDQDFAQLAHDDSGPLSAIESAIRYLVSAPNAPRGGFMSDVGKAGRSLAAAGPGFGAGAYGAAAAPFEVAGLDAIGGWLRSQQKSAQAVSKDVAGVDPNAGFVEQSVLSGFQSAGQNLLTLPLGFAAKGEALMLGAMGLVTGGQSYGKARDAGLAPAAAAAYGIEDAAAEIVTEKFLGAAGFLKQIKAGASAGKLFGYEVLKEVPGEIGATLWQNFNEWGNVNPDKSVADFIAEQPEAIAQTIIATLVGGSVQIGAVKGAQRVMQRFDAGSMGAAQANMSATQLDAIAAVAQASKLRERSPETFQQFAQDLADAHTPAIFVDAQALMQSGVNIDEVARAMPSVAAQLQQAVATGGDIEIPAAEFVAAVPGSTFQQQMIDHARTGANAMSRAEAEVFMKDKGGAIKAEIEAEAVKHEQDATWQMQRDEVRAGFEQQLNAAGRFQPAVNKSYAAVLGDFYAVTASRAGMTPQELVQRYPLRIQAQMPGGQANVMEQAGPARTRVESSKDGLTKHSILNDAGEVIGSMSVLDRNTLVNGEPVGVAQIHNVGIDDAQAKGNGYGVQAYREVIDAALSAGKVVWSDPSVSADAQHVYEALKRRGYTVETNSAKPATKEADGTMVSKGSFVYRVTAGPKALNQSAAAPRDLIVTHNLTADNLLHAKKMGGIAVPSLAVTKKDTPLGGFGEITLVGDSTLADPKGYAGTKVFGADIYSPRYPAVERELDAKKQAALAKALKPMADKLGETLPDTSDLQREGQRSMERSPAVIATFLKEQGIEPEVVAQKPSLNEARVERLKTFGLGEFLGTTDLHKMLDNPRFIDAAMAEQIAAYEEAGFADKKAGLIKKMREDAETRRTFARDTAYAIVGDAKQRANPTPDRYATLTAMEGQIKDAGLADKFPAWVKAKLDDITKSERISQGFTNSGNRKYIPHTLENVVKILKKDLRGGESFNYGVGSLRAKFTPEFKSLDAIRKAKGRLVSAADFEKVKKEVDAEFDKLRDDLDISSDALVAILEDAPKMGLDRAAKDFDAKLTPETRQAAVDFLNKLRDLPTAYFEAKVLRDVSPSEFKAAVVPHDVDPAALKYLKDSGIADIRTYQRGDEAGRAAAIGELEHLFFQDARAQISFGPSIADSGAVISLLENADLSSFIHESGHLFLEIQADLAARIQSNIDAGENVTEGERQIVADMNRLLEWFGVKGSPEQSAIGEWHAMTLEQKRQHHETFARGWEAYAFEGNSPNLELAAIFQRFRAWLVDVYKHLTGNDRNPSNAKIGKALQVNLSDEVRQVMDRMIATEEQIKEAETARAMGPLFTEQGGRSAEWWAEYQANGEKATQTSVDKLQARALADMKWLSNARAKKLRELQAKADELRREIRREVTRDVMARPVYRAWQFLTMKGEADERAVGEPRVKGSAGELDVTRDNIFQAIAKLGGLNRDELASQWGHDHKAESIQSGVFGRPVVRKEGGLPIDMMTEALVAEGYLMPDENGRGDPRDLEEAFDSQRMGVDQFSVAHDYAEKMAAANGEQQPVEPLPEHITHGKLDTNVLREMYGTQAEAIWRKLSDRRMTSENGVQPDVLAETMGFPSGDAMVRELANARAPRDVIRDLTDQRMLQEHGELSTPEGLDKATTEALANKVRTRFLATELQALEDAGKAQDKPGKDGKQRSTASALDKAAEVYAARTIGAMQIKDIKPHKFEAAATRAAKLAAKAFKAGKTAEAAMHKRSELIQMHAAKAAHEALAEVGKAREQFGKINSRPLDTLGKTYDVDVVQAIRAVLAEYGLSTKGEQAAKYLEAVERNDPDMHKVLKAQIDAMAQQAKPFDTLTVDGMRALVDEIGAMWHLARRSRQMEVDGNLIDREEVQAELLRRLEEIGIPEHMPGEGKAVTDKERRISRIREAGAALMRVENWAIRKDGQDNGVFTRFVFRPIKAASDAYRAERGAVLKKYRNLVACVDLGVGRISAPELGYEFGFSKGGSGKQELLHAILHTGNDSNKRKLLLGRKWADVMQDGETVDTGRWDRFIERMIREGKLTRADFDFVQGVWDLLESLKPAAQKTHRDVFGKYFDEITANPVTNSLGTWRGGYVPAMTDAEVVKDAKTRDLAEAENSTMAFAFPSTAKGFTKARVEYNKPLLLDLRALAGHIDKVLLFSHLEQPVRDVRRILTSGQVAEPMHKVDPAAFGSLITPWLNRAARQQVETPIPGDGGAMRILSKLRARAGMAAMMANLSNTVQQIAGFSIAAVKVPPRHLLSAAHRYITSPRKVTEAVCEASLAMRERADNEAHMMTQDIQQILLNPSLYERAQDWSARHAYFMQSAVDNVMGPIIWTGAYNHALEQGHTEDDARAMADSTVRTTQGSTLAEDIARIETGNAWWRMFAQFAGYFNMQANLLGTEFSNQMHDQGLRKGMGKGLYIFTLGFLVPALLSELIVQAFRGGPDDEDKDGETLDDWLSALGLGTIRGAIAMVPVAGQAANYAINLANTKPYDDRISTAPAISMLESVIRAPFSVYEAAVNDKSAQKAVRDVATLISLTTGLPANAIARPAGYVAGMADDKINPTGPADLARGLVTGVASPGSKQ